MSDSSSNVVPMTLPEQVLEDEMVAQLVGQGYTRTAVTDEASMLANLKAKLEAFAKYLGTTLFLAGKRVSVADLKFYDTLTKIALCEKEETKTTVIASNPVLTEFMARVEALPAISTYLQSDKFLSRPLNNTHAQFK